MNVSSASASYTGQTSFTGRPQGPPPNGKQQAFAQALEDVGVDESTASSVLSQIEEAVAGTSTDGLSGAEGKIAIQSAVEEVLQANGIDASEFDEAMKANRPSGPSPRGPKPDSDDTSSVESALLAANVDESSLDFLLSEMIQAITETSSNEATGTTPDSMRSAMTEVLQEHGIDVATFEKAFGSQFSSSGNFLDRVA
ncbi:hypothetical protein N9N28_12820 [Rubripirellula amarantea]|nr:hypothetical protein [Rubripirellula amarantea]